MPENAELVRRRFRAFNVGGPEARALWSTLALDVVCEVAIGVDRVDGVYKGRAGVRRFWQRFSPGLRRMRIAVEELVDCGERVFCATRVIGSGRHSGAVAAGGRVFLVVTLRDGLIARCQLFTARQAALDAAGLSEE